MISDILLIFYFIWNKWDYFAFGILIKLLVNFLQYFDRQNIKLITTNVEHPKKATDYSAGIDIPCSQDVVIKAGKRLLIDTGIKIKKCPSDCYLRVAPRSGLSVKGLDVAAGVVDTDYRGEIKVLLCNNGDTDFTFKNGDFIAQLIPEKIYDCDILINNKFVKNKIKKREQGGFGSSDKKEN